MNNAALTSMAFELAKGAVLRRLSLSQEELQCLCRQGFVAGELRGGRRFYKLRFRVAGRQRVKTLGTDEAFAQAVRDELRLMQMPRTSLRKLNEMARNARAEIRIINQQLRPTLEAAGFYFHGHAVRHRRERGGV